jgi:hypothetical protein
MTFLIVSNERDLTTDFIVRELGARGRSFVRLNTERLAKASVAFNPGTSDFAISCDGSLISVQSITAAYFRRPETPREIADLDEGEQAYALAEWNALMKALYICIGGRWFSHPRDIILAEDKPEQLRLAKTLGFQVPDTLITNDLDAARKFVGEGKTIAKPLRQAVMEEAGAERVVFTSAVEELLEADRASLRFAPVIFQRQIQKRLDLRVTVVGDKVFAAAIHSQETAETMVDWRKGYNPDLRHEVYQLPDSVARRCIEFVNRQKLRFGAIDLVLDPEGTLWFLECNPNGQWAWIENRTGMPIAAAIVDELEKIAAS